MSLDKILSISGKPGLYELKTQTRGGFLAESLVDGKKVSVNTRQNVSLLSEIAIYTLTEELPLRVVFGKISEKEKGGPTISHKSSKDELEEYFFEVLPDYDEDKVYVSDIKKVLQWYNLLHKSGITDFSEKEESDATETAETPLSKIDKKSNLPKTTKPKMDSVKASSNKKGGASKNTSARKT